MTIAKAWAPINLALIKYWGKADEELRLPMNTNLSICLSKLGTETEVEFEKGLAEDEVIINGETVEAKARERVVKHLDRVRRLAGINLKARVVSENNFPMKAGLSSSASGLAALSLAASRAAGLELSEEELTRLARIGSGSACRSIPDGWVEWVKGKDDQSSIARSLWPADYWDLRILVVLLSEKAKAVGSTAGMSGAATSEFFKTRLRRVKQKMREIKAGIKEKNFSRLGRLTEEECLNMHAVMITQKPGLIYWLPETVRVMRKVIGWRESGLESYFTINTGQNVFVICRPEDESGLVVKLEQVKGVKQVIRERIGQGARLIEKP